MSHAKVYHIGAYSGTIKELAKITGISPANMRNRVTKWLNGQYSAQKCMAIGSISRARPAVNGNAAWRALQDRGKTHIIA